MPFLRRITQVLTISTFQIHTALQMWYSDRAEVRAEEE